MPGAAAWSGRSRLLRYLVLCLVLLLGLQALLSLLSARCTVPVSLFHFDSAAASRAESAAATGGGATARLVLTLAATQNGSAAAAVAVRDDPLISSVMADKKAPPRTVAPAPPPAASANNKTAAPAAAAPASNSSAAAGAAAAAPAAPAAASVPSEPKQQQKPTQPKSPPEGTECPPVPLNLVGPLAVPRTAPGWEELERLGLPLIRPGGRFSPQHCVARHRVAIVVPYRDREEHLRLFLYHMHPILQRQLLDYGIFIIEQAGTDSFNRAALLNAGALEALKQHDFGCFVFHDVDLLMEDDRNLYTCPDMPRHMSVAIDSMNYQLAYPQLFGGVSAMNVDQFRLVNGFSNLYWGWGGEDDDMYNRITHHHLHIARYPANVARYKMIKHQHAKVNPRRFDLLRKGHKRFDSDGLSSLEYEVKDIVMEPLYTRILIHLKR